MLLETPCCDSVGKHKESSFIAHFLIEPFDQQFVLVIQHGVESGSADVAIARTVNGVAELHVVSRHGFRDRIGGSSHLKKATRHFLPRADLRKSSVAFAIEIYLERFLVRSDIHFRLHASKKS